VPPPEQDEGSWRGEKRAETHARRRANRNLMLIALAVLLAATAGFLVPMLLTN
jgi:hypothetical protein